MKDPAAIAPARLRTWQGITIATLFTGYAGYYVCRSVLPVASTEMLNDSNLGIDKVAYGNLLAVGTVMYAIGKLCNGLVTEYIGGRAIFLLGMALSAICVFAFSQFSGAGVTALLVIWGVNRFVQSMGWNALIQITGRWFRPESLATVMGVLCLSYLFGDAFARLYLGEFVKQGVSWQGVFGVAAGTLGVITFVSFFTLKASPTEIGLPEPPPPPGNLHESTTTDTRLSVAALLMPLLTSRMFWLVCLMNGGLCSIRETFNSWTPLYLEQVVGIPLKDTGQLSFIFPFTGAVASLAAGWTVDRTGGRYGRVAIPLMVLTVAALGAFLLVDLRGHSTSALVLIAVVGLFMMGPYTFCSGVMALNLGGRRAGAVTAGIVDTVGYLCASAVNALAGHLVKAYGFDPLLQVLFGLAVMTLVISVVYWIIEERRRKTL